MTVPPWNAEGVNQLTRVLENVRILRVVIAFAADLDKAWAAATSNFLHKLVKLEYALKHLAAIICVRLSLVVRIRLNFEIQQATAVVSIHTRS